MDITMLILASYVALVLFCLLMFTLLAVAIRRINHEPGARLALGLYALATGTVFVLAVYPWTSPSQGYQLQNLFLAGLVLIVVGVYLCAATLVALGEIAWPIAVAAALLSTLFLVLNAVLYPGMPPLIPMLFGGMLLFLYLLRLYTLKQHRLLLGRAFLFASKGVGLITLVLVLRGPHDWIHPPFGVDVLIATLVIGVVIFVMGHRRFPDTLRKICILVLNKRKTGDDCIYFPERVINRPDPCIYSQFLLMQLHQPVTWDNPDIALFLNGIEQYTYDLTVSTAYDVVTTIHNSSREKPAMGTQVSVRWIEFGAGAQIRHEIVMESVDVPVWPSVATVTTPWETPSAPGHYCIEVELYHPNDGDPSNNRGWNNTQVKAASSPVETSIRIFNQLIENIAAAQPNAEHPRASRGTLRLATTGPTELRSRAVHEQRVPANLVELTVDSYKFNDAVGKEADLDEMFAPREAAWSARVEPNRFFFGDRELYRDVMLIVEAPDMPGATEVFNVTARQGGIPIGGVTVTVKR